MNVLVLTARTDLPEAELCLGLSRRGVQLEVWSEASSPHRERLLAAGIPCETISFASRFDLRSVLRLRRVMKEGKYDLAHYFSARALTAGLMASRSLPLRHVAYRGTVGRLSRFGLLSRLSYLHPRLDRVICVSEAVRRYLITLSLPPSKAVTIHKGHSLDWYGDPYPDLTDVDIPRGAFVIGCVANMRPVKGVDVLVKAFGLLPPDVDLHLLLVGEPGKVQLDPLLNALPRPDRVHVTGYRTDATRLIGAASVFVMPSIAREGLPKAVIEAMAQGVPTIVTNVGGMPELVEHERSGLVAPPSSPEALRDAILRLAREPALRDELGRAAKERIAAHFSIEMTIEKTLATYRNVLQS